MQDFAENHPAKGARIRVLFDEKFCQVFPDVVKGAPDIRFHAGKPVGGRVSDRQ